MRITVISSRRTLVLYSVDMICEESGSIEELEQDGVDDRESSFGLRQLRGPSILFTSALPSSSNVAVATFPFSSITCRYGLVGR
jgi:hypothetical protein